MPVVSAVSTFKLYVDYCNLDKEIPMACVGYLGTTNEYVVPYEL